MHTETNEIPGSTVRSKRTIDHREKQQIMETVYQSPVYREFLKQWGGVLSIGNTDPR